MFSSYIALKRARFTSGASFKRFFLVSYLFPITKPKFLSFVRRGSHGRRKGTIVCRTKGRELKKTRTISVQTPFKFVTLGFMGDFLWSVNPIRFYTFLMLSNGAFRLTPMTTEHKPFIFFWPNCPWKFRNYSFPSFFYALKIVNEWLELVLFPQPTIVKFNL